MAILFALPALYERVAARFVAEGTDVPMAFGWLAPAEQMAEVTRITWTPGDESGALGTIVPPRSGTVPRQLAQVLELCTIEIAAFDPTRAGDELAQYRATRELLDALVRALRLEAFGTVDFLASKWIGGDRAFRAGGAIRMVIAVRAPILDEAAPYERVSVGVAVAVAELDQTEDVDLPPA